MPTRCLPYEEVTSEELGRRAAQLFDYRYEGESLLLEGTCPRCDGAMTYSWPLTVVRGVDPTVLGESARREADAPALKVTVICCCVLVHPRAPAGEGGCGAYWRLTVPRPS